MRRLWSATVRVVVVGAALLGLVAVGAFAWQLRPAGDVERMVVLDIAEGTSFSSVARRLWAHRIIRSDEALVWMGRLRGLDRRIIPGEYELDAGMSSLTILRKLAEGDVRSYAVTIPEGFSARQIADVLHDKQLADRAEYLRLAGDPAFIRTLALPVVNLEGYLFPDTYLFARHMKPAVMIQSMVSRFKRVVTEDDRRRADALGWSLHQVVTLASVIEKETSRSDERALVSGVFHNRLRRNIRLQSDPTVIYALHEFDGDLRKKDLSVKSPYNTYRVRGLPPGPIANPGKASIHAALYPAPTDYLYFVSRNDGSHEFSATLADHIHAVRKYQIRHRRRSS